MIPDELLDFLDAGTRKAIFDQNLAKLKTEPQFDLDTVKICVRLAAQENPHQARGLAGKSDASNDTSTSRNDPLNDDNLWGRILQRISDEESSEHFYDLADICLGNGAFAAAQLNQRLHLELDAVLVDLTNVKNQSVGSAMSLDSTEKEGNIQTARAYLQFLRASFGLPPNRFHMISPSSVSMLSSFVGVQGLDEEPLDTLGALFSLLRNGGPIAVAEIKESLLSWTEYSEDLNAMVLHGSIVNQSFWDQGLEKIYPEYFDTHAVEIFQVWFQWISQALIDNIELDCLQLDRYWKPLSTGLLNGYADQRKYCLGIINQSLQLARQDILTRTMEYHVTSSYRAAYNQYASLFETIVLHRYANQVEASLPELTNLLGPQSKISTSMATTLLSAALNPKVQEGIRKLIGYWYINHVSKGLCDINGHFKFLVEGFLPWATDGSLFNSSLKSTRRETACTHGAAIAMVIAQFVSATQEQPTSVPQTKFDTPGYSINVQRGRAVVLGVVHFILDAGGKIFQPAVLYLLEGLITGLQAHSVKNSLTGCFTLPELSQILRVARLPGLPEISSDLLSLYCLKLCDLIQPNMHAMGLYGHEMLQNKVLQLGTLNDAIGVPVESTEISSMEPLSLQTFATEILATNHECIQGAKFAWVCKRFTYFLNKTDSTSIDHEQLLMVLQALWDEAERREFGRSVAMYLPPVLFHSVCIEVCIGQHYWLKTNFEESLEGLLSKVMTQLQKLSKGRSYIISVLATSLRKAAFHSPYIISILPFEEFVLDYLNYPPASKPEFLFEVAAAEKLQQIMPHRHYTSYYGQREWHAYAALIDLLQRFPEQQLDVAKRVLLRLIKPWQDQKAPIPIRSSWKDTLQLQAILILSDYCITEFEAEEYIDYLMQALVLEPWPRYRYLLEWIIARIYCRFPGKSSRILNDLAKPETFTPIHIASLMKLGLLVAPFESEDFAVRFVTQLTCFSASPKVQIRHEANFAYPIIFDLVEARKWTRITENPAFTALNTFIRQLDKFQASAWTIRTLRLDAVQDFSLSKIFQGQYLIIESPEKERVSYEDFIELEAKDSLEQLPVPVARIPVGDEPKSGIIVPKSVAMSANVANTASTLISAPAFLQTKAGFDIESLYPTAGPPSTADQRPASVILVASLIDNPTNLGGLSRISESFGLEALYIDDLKKAGHKDFKATSVTSEKHLPIHALKVAGVPQFLVDAKRKGYVVVGIEQTDRSGTLGDEGGGAPAMRKKDIGTLPKKCVLVLGAEKSGITPEVLSVIDRCVEIRTIGVTRSLNVQTAGGIAVYEWWREWGWR